MPRTLQTPVHLRRPRSIEPPSPVDRLLRHHSVRLHQPSAETLASAALRTGRAVKTATGALAIWNKPAETGRIPHDTYIIRTPAVESWIDWQSSAVHPMDKEVFDQLLEDTCGDLAASAELFTQRASAGADPCSAVTVDIVTDCPVAALFAQTMLREDADCSGSVLGSRPLTLVIVPRAKIRTERYANILRSEGGKTVDMCIVMDCERRIGLVYGTAYLGTIKKLVFSMMNVLLPRKGMLPLHCAASAADDGSSVLFLGLSGTGKTTLSTSASRSLIGDDEHIWSARGIANMEGGCYAKLLRLQRAKEPEIYDAAFAPKSPVPRVIIENAMVYPDGSVDTDDDRISENSRCAFPLSFLPNIVPCGYAGQPSCIIFLTADAQGILPPVAQLSPEEAVRWFFLGYTSKLAGAETGITLPRPNFSRFFGGPFMMAPPEQYIRLFRAKLLQHQCPVYLVNTGWTGGAYGTGQRMDITVSRAVTDAAISGALQKVPLLYDERFRFHVPQACLGVDSTLFNPRATWGDACAYDAAADALAAQMRLQTETMGTSMFANR